MFAATKPYIRNQQQKRHHKHKTHKTNYRNKQWIRALNKPWQQIRSRFFTSFLGPVIQNTNIIFHRTSYIKSHNWTKARLKWITGNFLPRVSSTSKCTFIKRIFVPSPSTATQRICYKYCCFRGQHLSMINYHRINDGVGGITYMRLYMTLNPSLLA